MDAALRDLRFALRILGRRPLFTAVAVGTLGLGIGASSTVFSVVNGVLLWHPPYEAPDQLVSVSGTFPRPSAAGSPEATWMEGYLSFPEYQRWRDHQTRFRQVAVYSEATLVMTGLDRPERVRAGVASASLFPTLGVRPALGRGILPGEDGPDARRVMVLSHGFWTDRLGGDPGVLGRTVTLNDQPFEVVGVLPRGFRLRSFGAFSTASDSGDRPFWVPAGAERSRLADGDRAYEGLGRLAPGVTVEHARTETETLIRGEKGRQERGARLVAREELEVRGFRKPLLVLLAASAVLLLIACGNVAALVVAEVTHRRQELAVRRALGAGARRLLGQIVAEGAVLGLGGAGIGAVLALAGTRAVLRLAPPLPHLDQVTVGVPVLLFGAALGLATGILFGLAPLGELSSTVERGPRRRTLEAAILPLQMALTVVLLVGGGLLGRSLLSLLSVDPGFEASGLVLLRPGLSVDPRTGPGPWEVYPELVARLAAVPEVRSASALSSLPFHGFPEDAFLEIPGREPREDEEPLTADRRQVLPGYFETLRIPLLQGRSIEPTDGPDSPPVVVVSEALARLFWPGASALGRQMGFSGLTFTVVGIVGDIRHQSLAGEGSPTFYLPYQQYRRGPLTLVARTDSDPYGILPALREAVWEVDPDAVMGETLPVSELLARATGGERFRAALLGVFALSALLLAAAGVLGVVARDVARRTRELGIRKALGARDGELMGSVVGATLRWGALGMALGLLGAVWASRVVSSYLFGVRPLDPWTLMGAVLLLGVTALLAAFLPARRITGVEAAEALRAE